MHQYRVYSVAPDGKFIEPTIILVATDDNDAIRQAVEHRLKSAWGIEVWTANRLVALTTFESNVFDQIRGVPALDTDPEAVKKWYSREVYQSSNLHTERCSPTIGKLLRDVAE